MALTASVFNQQLAAGLVPGRGRGLSKAVRYLCRVGHTMKLPGAAPRPPDRDPGAAWSLRPHILLWAGHAS